MLTILANSEDRARLDLSYEVINLTFPAATADTPAPEASAISIGRDWYLLSNNLPPGTDFHWGVNMKFLNETETLAQITRLSAAFQNSPVQLRELEIGNEMDLGNLGPQFTPANYTNTWKQYVKDAISTGAITLGDQSGIYASPGAFARSNRFGTNWVWTAMSTFGAGLIDDVIKGVTRQYTGHLYSASYDAKFAVTSGVLMDKANVRGNLTTKVADAEVSRKYGLDYVLVSNIRLYACSMLTKFRGRQTHTQSK